MIDLSLHVSAFRLACLGCLFMLPLQTEEVLSPRNPRRHHATGWVLRRCWAGVGAFKLLSNRPVPSSWRCALRGALHYQDTLLC